MLQILPNSSMTHVITWELKNFSQYPLQFMKDLKSPEILINCLDLTIWRLFIYISRDEMITCKIRRMDINNTINIVDVDYNICLLGRNDVKYFCNTGKFAATLNRRSCYPLYFTSPNLLQNYHLKEDALVIHGNLIFTVNQENILNRLFDKHFIKLSVDISNLLQNGLFSDHTLKSGENEFKVHKCILSACWPYAVSPDSTTEMNRMSPEVLDIVLKCVYFQVKIRPEFKLHSDLLISARKCHFPELEYSLKNYPVECHIITPLNQGALTFTYDLIRIEMWPESFRTDVRILPISELSVKDLIVTFSLAKDSEGRKYLGISFQFSAFNKSRSVVVDCKMSVVNQTNHIMNPLEYKKIFERDEEWNLPPYFTEETYPCSVGLKLRCEVYMCDGIDKKNERYVSSRYAVNRPEYLINDLAKQSACLHSLLLRPDFSDMDMLVKGVIFKLHKAILSARSPWFKNYLINNDKYSTEHCILTLDDFNLHIVKMVLHYIYAGRLDIKNKETIPELLSAAEFFQMPLLATYIRESISESL